MKLDSIPSQIPANSGSQDSDKKDIPVEETGGPKGPEPTRYGDWERKGKCVDF